MDVYRVGESLLRSSQLFVLPFLAPSAYRAPHATRAARHCKRQCQTSRQFATSQYQRQQSAAAARQEEDESPRDFPSTAPSSTNTVGNDLSSLLDSSLDFKKGTPTAASTRTSLFSSSNAQSQTPPSRARANQLGASRSSLDDLIGAMDSSRSRSPPSRSRPSNSVAAEIFSMINNQDADMSSHSSGPPAPDEEPPMKLGPTIGRTVRVDANRGMDVGRAFRTLEIECAKNSVRRDFMRQRFHERPGLKRKRLKSERWRKNFKTNFRGVVAMVQKMRKQGW